MPSGRYLCYPHPQTDDKGKIVKGAWAAGDNSAVPDLTGGGLGFCLGEVLLLDLQGQFRAAQAFTHFSEFGRKGGFLLFSGEDFFFENFAATAKSLRECMLSAPLFRRC